MMRSQQVSPKFKDQRGVTLLETAIVLPMLLLLAVGLAEVGFLVIDNMAVANAAREGARVGAAAGPYEDATGTINADTLILRSVEQALCHIENGQATRVLIYLADADGGFADLAKVNTYDAPSSGVLNCSSSGLTLFSCDTCPWDPTTRDNTPPDLDDIGVLVEFEHSPILGIFPFTNLLNLSDRAVMRIEPDTRG
jgi:Flp pilus assembly protein TadG